jgi:hypothetical protein
MIFNIVSPITATIDGYSFKDAIKNFVKLNHDLKLSQMIITDQKQNIKANINYYREDSRNKVGIKMVPVGFDYPLPLVLNDSYIPPRVIDTSSIIPLSPIPLSPIMAPFVPMVINIPNI